MSDGIDVVETHSGRVEPLVRALHRDDAAKVIIGLKDIVGSLIDPFELSREENMKKRDPQRLISDLRKLLLPIQTEYPTSTVESSRSEFFVV